MDKLQTVRQESKSDILPTVPMQILQEELPPGKCTWVNEKGNDKGKEHGAPTFNGNKYCSVHAAIAQRREVLEEKKENTTNIVVKCSELVKDEIPMINIQPPPRQDNNMELLAKIRSLESPITLPQVQQPLVHSYAVPSSTDIPINDIITILKNFSVAMMNLTELHKR